MKNRETSRKVQSSLISLYIHVQFPKIHVQIDRVLSKKCFYTEILLGRYLHSGNLNTFLTRLRKLFKRGNYSREETICGNTVYELEYGIRTANCSPWDHCVMMPSLDHQKSNFSLIFGNLSVVGCSGSPKLLIRMKTDCD